MSGPWLMLPAKSHPSSHANGCCPPDRNRSTPEPYHGLIRPIFEIVKSLQGWNHHNLVRHNCGYRSSVNECLDRAALSLHLNVVHRSEIDICGVGLVGFNTYAWWQFSSVGLTLSLLSKLSPEFLHSVVPFFIQHQE